MYRSRFYPPSRLSSLPCLGAPWVEMLLCQDEQTGKTAGAEGRKRGLSRAVTEGVNGGRGRLTQAAV